MKSVPEARYCNSPKLDEGNAGACAGDEFGIFTGPDFGCVHHEEKP